MPRPRRWKGFCYGRFSYPKASRFVSIALWVVESTELSMAVDLEYGNCRCWFDFRQSLRRIPLSSS